MAEIVLSIQDSARAVLQIKLRQVMEDYRQRTGERLTYADLAERTGLSRRTVESLASRETYNTTLSTVEKLCRVLGCQPGDLLVLAPEERGGAKD